MGGAHRRRNIFRPWAALAVAAALHAFGGVPKSAFADAAEAVQNALRDGGLIVYIRHPEAIVGVDTDLKNLENCQTQRRLTDVGREESGLIGEAFRRQRFPVSAVLTSPFCRTRNAAFIAFGTEQTTLEPNLTSTCKTSMQAVHERRMWLRNLLSERPESGNLVLMGHNCNIRNVLPPDAFPECARRPRMSDAVIFTPGGNGTFTLFACLAREQLYLWGGGSVD